MEGIQDLLRGIQETLNQQGMLLQKNNRKINSINQRVKTIERQIYTNHSATATTLEYVHEDCQNIFDNTVDLQSKARRSSRIIKNLGNGLKLPMDKYMSDSDSYSRRSHPPGNRRNKQMRRNLEPVIQNHKPFSTPASDSDSDDDVDMFVNEPQAGDHRLIPSGHKSLSQSQSQGEPHVTEEVPTTVPPMNNMVDDIKTLQSAANNSQGQYQPDGQFSPVPGQPANISGQTVSTDSASNILMSPKEQLSSSTKSKNLSSSLSSNGSTNQMEQSNALSPSQSNIPPQTRQNVLPSGKDKSSNSMFLDQRPNIDVLPHTQPETSSLLLVPTTTEVVIPHQASQQTTTSPSLSEAIPTTLQTTPTARRTTPAHEEATSTSLQTTPTSIQTTPASLQTTPTTISNIPLTNSYHTNVTQATPSLPVVTNVPTTLSSRGPATASAPWTGEMGLFLEPDFSSIEKVIGSLELPDNNDTKRAINTAFASDVEPSMERPKGLYTVLLVDTSFSTSSSVVKTAIKSFIEGFMDEIEDSAANETLEENVALVTFGRNTGVQQGFTNDFSLIRDAFDSLPYAGRSPLATGLAVCLTYMEKSSKELQQNGLEIFPRLILLTDGYATEDAEFADDNDQPDPTAVDVKARVIQIVRLFHAKKYPLSCGAVNQKYSDEAMIDDISAIGGGTKIELFPQANGLDQAKVLGRYYLYQTIVAQVKNELEESGGLGDASKILMDTTENKTLDQRDRVELVDMLRSHDIVAKFDEQLAGVGGSEESDNEMLKSYTFQELAHMPPIGSRVKKGPQWKQGMSDPGGLGTVVAHASEGVVVVKWDKGKVDRYQYRTDFQEVTFPGGPSQPRQFRSERDINVGCWVKRGRHWSKGDEDGQASHGVVVRRHRNMSVTVKWPIGIVERYKCGQDGIMEVEAVTYAPESQLQSNGQQPQSHGQQLPVPTRYWGCGSTSERRRHGVLLAVPRRTQPVANFDLGGECQSGQPRR
ncbi:uncharacterized protein LOC117334920 [Pecten maximus]|uniref:uncharacterized protein LOC117334920 n=1 Tax=Pecten maximus TaxID=6579 RepID=UPI0014580DF3|nr:uncharacterized protein LOC117334920 [Pecten maximus]XP_033750660.1 uncharacterized protein LOC117334920 [Pecten maximus]